MFTAPFIAGVADEHDGAGSVKHTLRTQTQERTVILKEKKEKEKGLQTKVYHVVLFKKSAGV